MGIVPPSFFYMNGMTNTEYFIETSTKDLVLLLMEQQHKDMETALRTLYNSTTYHKLIDPRTGLYFQSPSLHNSYPGGI
jgi:hypothetical protein